MRRTLITLLLAAAVAASGACTPDRVDSPDPTVPTAPSTTTVAAPTTAPDPFAVPATIDAAYVDRVLVELNKVYGDVARKVITTNRFERADLDPLGAIFNPPLLDVQAGLFRDLPNLDRALFKDPIGSREMMVLEVITALPDCIFVKVSFDVSQVVVAPPQNEEKYVTLSPTPKDADPGHLNPTTWSMVNESNARQDPCVG